jgi:glycosyltransferase involved in cell wall biosynthesis
MRIAILAWESLHSVAVGGMAAHASELASALAAKGHQIHFFTRRMPGQSAHECIDGVHYHRCCYFQQRDFVDDVNSMCRSFVDRFFEVEDFIGKFDIVHAHDWLDANAMIWIKQGSPHNTVLTIHSTEYARCGNAFYSGRSDRIREQERAGTWWADRIIAVSEATKKEIMWMYNVSAEKVQAIGNGVDWKKFDIETDSGKVKTEYGIAPLDPTVLYCGRLAWQKGPDILIEAIPGVLREHPGAKFILVGDGDMRGGLEARARHLGVAHTVRFLGYRNGNELVRLFKSCDVVCVPSRNEPFGIVVLEGWSANKPVVVTENGGPNEFIIHEKNGLKIYPRPDSVTWGINRVFSNFDWSRQLGRQGRKLVEERYSWDKITDATLEIYHQLCPQVIEKPITVKEITQASPKPRDTVLAVHSQNENVILELKAKVVIPPSSVQNTEAYEILDTLKTNLASYGFVLRQKEHSLIIRGECDEVIRALYESWERLHQSHHTEEINSQSPLLEAAPNGCG